MLYKHKLYINNCNIVDERELLTSKYITVKIRGIGRNPEHPVRVERDGNGYMVSLNDPAWAPAIGQPLVFYRKNMVIGGGIVVGFE
jgi:tRNA-specific 2-thiouridylase